MSRLPFWVPPGGGGSQHIPKLVVKGFEKSPDVRDRTVARFMADARQFYTKAARNHALGNVDVSASRRETKDYKLSYTNIRGMETVTMELDPARPTIPPKPGKETFPDYAVIDFIIQNHQDMEWKFSAALVAPDIGRATALMPPDFLFEVVTGVELDDGGSFDYSDGIDNGLFDPPALIKAADAEEPDGEVTGFARRAMSLKVDFTTSPDHITFEVDIYAHVDPETVTIDDPPIFLGWTHRTDFNTDPPTSYGYTHSVPGDIYLEDGFTPNPACLTGYYEYTTLGSVIAGAPSPSTICFYPAIGGVEISSGGENFANATGLDWMIANIPMPPFVYYPPEGYVDYFTDDLIYDQIHQATYDWHVNISGTHSPPPAPYHAAGYDYYYENSVQWIENDLFFTKRPVYDFPYHNVDVPISSPCDIVYGFYEKGSHLLEDYAIDYPGYPNTALWVLTNNQLPGERSLYKTIEISSDRSEGVVTVDNPQGYGYLGRLAVDRATRSIGFTLAP